MPHNKNSHHRQKYPWRGTKENSQKNQKKLIPYKPYKGTNKKGWVWKNAKEEIN